MTTFKVGEIAIGCNMVYDGDRNGMECTILEGPHDQMTLHMVEGAAIRRVYFVEWADGQMSTVIPQRLRKKRPPGTDDATARQAMLDCIERAKQPQGVPA